MPCRYINRVQVQQEYASSRHLQEPANEEIIHHAIPASLPTAF